MLHQRAVGGTSASHEVYHESTVGDDGAAIAGLPSPTKSGTREGDG
jgi:hypothetical protein